MFNKNVWQKNSKTNAWVHSSPAPQVLVKLIKSENGIDTWLRTSRCVVIMNETHKLLSEQKAILEEAFPDEVSFLKVPELGWDIQEQEQVLKHLNDLLEKDVNVVFVSPVPVLLMWAAYLEGIGAMNKSGQVLVFHNDKREKKELPNGKIIMTVAQTGWELVG